MSLKRIITKTIAGMMAIYMVLGNVAIAGIGLSQVIAEDVQEADLPEFCVYGEEKEDLYIGWNFSQSGMSLALPQTAAGKAWTLLSGPGVISQENDKLKIDGNSGKDLEDLDDALDDLSSSEDMMVDIELNSSGVVTRIIATIAKVHRSQVKS